MRDPWRYALPCGHHSYHYRPTNDPHRRYVCECCDCECGKSDLIDKKHETIPT